MPEGDRPATRIALLELDEERRTAREGHALLDEKRMLLAARILQRLGALRRASADWREAESAARDALRESLRRHGLQSLEIWPERHAVLDLHREAERVLGIELPAVRPELSIAPPAREPVDPSPEAANCADRHSELLVRAATRAAAECALQRLADEYVRTERRTSAIEQVLLPELQHEHAAIADALEALEQEETARVHRARG
ncbi:MAG: V-type ATP synthase subunit D [Steroidobacteraceae bacterium]|jgi:V/A-type H+-transporting ATPase subunit D|nr:V-type ATP synthase subunit D [Steroidobacteraceae bacterium]